VRQADRPQIIFIALCFFALVCLYFCERTKTQNTMETKFKVGDRVRHETHGAGMVVSIISRDPAFGVCFDEMTEGHHCQGCCIDGKGWYCYEYELTPITSDQPTPPTHPDRAMIAAMALQGYLSIHSFQGSHNRLGGAEFDAEMAAKCAVAYADALIAELKKTKQ